MLRRLSNWRAQRPKQLDLTKVEPVTQRADATSRHNGFLGLDFNLGVDKQFRIGYAEPLSGVPSPVVPFFAGGLISVLFVAVGGLTTSMNPADGGHVRLIIAMAPYALATLSLIGGTGLAAWQQFQCRQAVSPPAEPTKPTNNDTDSLGV